MHLRQEACLRPELSPKFLSILGPTRKARPDLKLCEEQKEWRVQVCQDILEQLETELNLPKRVVTGDESWIFEYDPLTKRPSLAWKSALLPRPKKA